MKFLLLAAAMLAAGSALAAQGVVSHAIAMHGEPALPAGFAHLPYVNPDAPKGGALNEGARLAKLVQGAERGAVTEP